MMRKDLTEVVFILDRSGSMSGLEADTIGGYNSMLDKQKNEEGEAILSTILFDDRITVLHDRQSIEKTEHITDKDYFVRGSTALLDAVGTTIRHIGKVQKELSEEEKPGKTLFIITTDGMENASSRYTYEKVKKMVEKKKNKKGWEFIFLGANMDAISVAGRFGVAANRAVRFENDGYGAELNYAVMSEIVSVARKASSADEMIAKYEKADAPIDAVRNDYDEFIKFSKERTSAPDYDSIDMEDLESVIGELPERHQKIVRMLYGVGGEERHTYEEAAAAFNMSSTRVRQCEAKMRKLIRQKVQGKEASKAPSNEKFQKGED